MGTKTNKQFLKADGSTSKHASPDAIALQIEFVNGESRTFDPSKLSADMIRCFTFHGMSQKIGDGGAGKDVSEFIDKVDSIWEAVLEDRWIDRAEGATRTSLLAESIAEVKPEKYTVAQAVEMLKGKSEDERAAIAKLPAVVAVLERKKAERAQARAKAAATALDNAPEDTSDLI